MEQKKNLKYISQELSKINDSHQATDPGSTKNSKRDKNKHTCMHTYTQLHISHLDYGKPKKQI